MGAPGRWSPAEATKKIRACAGRKRFSPHWKSPALCEQLHQCGVIVGDVLRVLKNGTVKEPGVPSDVTGFFRYRIQGRALSVYKTLVVTVVAGHEEVKIMDVAWKEKS